MNWLKNKINQAIIYKAIANSEEEALYARAASEIADGNIRPGLWAKANSDADGDERKVHARYIGLRVEQFQLQLSAGLAVATILPPKKEILPKLKEITPTPETHVRCPDCRGFVRREASLCRNCGCKLVPQ